MLRQGGTTQATKGSNKQKEVIPRYEYDTQLFDVEIYRAATNNVFVRSHDSSTLPQMVPAIVSLVGDSSISAHYRLGVGINQAFAAAQDMGSWVRQIARLKASVESEDEKKNSFAFHMASLRTLLDEQEQADQQRMQGMVQFQLSTMFFESYCDYAVLFDQNAETSFQSQLIYAKDRRRKDYAGEHTLSAKHIVDMCPILKNQLT